MVLLNFSCRLNSGSTSFSTQNKLYSSMLHQKGYFLFLKILLKLVAWKLFRKTRTKRHVVNVGHHYQKTRESRYIDLVIVDAETIGLHLERKSMLCMHMSLSIQSYFIDNDMDKN